MNQPEMLYQFSLLLLKILNETNADELKYTLSGATKHGKQIGDYELVFKKKEEVAGDMSTTR